MEAALAKIATEVDAIEKQVTDTLENGGDEPAWSEGVIRGMTRAATIIREALAAEAAPLCNDCNHAPHPAHCCDGRNRVGGLNRGCECQTDSGQA